ncbi:MAG: DUF2065 domain-containing protein [Aestuariivirgaceae bacterium]
MSEIVTAIGLVLVIEGLIYALMPGGMKQIMALMQDLPEDSLRNTGMVAIAVGVAVVWMARTLLA